MKNRTYLKLNYIKHKYVPYTISYFNLPVTLVIWEYDLCASKSDVSNMAVTGICSPFIL